MYPGQIKLSHSSYPSYPEVSHRKDEFPPKEQKTPAKMWVFNHHVSYKAGG